MGITLYDESRKSGASVQFSDSGVDGFVEKIHRMIPSEWRLNNDEVRYLGT